MSTSTVAPKGAKPPRAIKPTIEDPAAIAAAAKAAAADAKAAAAKAQKLAAAAQKAADVAAAKATLQDKSPAPKVTKDLPPKQKPAAVAEPLPQVPPFTHRHRVFERVGFEFKNEDMHLAPFVPGHGKVKKVVGTVDLAVTPVPPTSFEYFANTNTADATAKCRIYDQSLAIFWPEEKDTAYARFTLQYLKAARKAARVSASTPISNTDGPAEGDVDATPPAVVGEPVVSEC